MYDPSTASVPDAMELEAAGRHTSIDSLVIDREAGTVYITDPEASIDVGAIGKGYATERLYEKLKSMGAESVALNIGGNIRIVGLKPDGKGWSTGITNPDKTSTEFATIISLGRTACVTSGDYERYYVVDGTRYHHIIDPDTLMPASYFSSVTIITEDSGLADALSTALFCVDYDRGVEMLEKIDAEVDVIWITRDGRIIKTDGIVEINE
jgi:thiamine biosynthesis lipoprotein